MRFGFALTEEDSLLHRTRAFAAKERVGSALRLLLLLWLVWAGVRAGAQAQGTRLAQPSAIAYDAAGNLYVADANREQVLEATLAGDLLVIAGTGTQGFAGDGGPATAAELDSPQGLAFGSDGTLYIADTGNARIRAVSQGVIRTFAGTGVPGYSGDGGPAAGARFRAPAALAVDPTGALLVCDTTDHRIRRVSEGTVTTFAGNGVQGFAGDGGTATSAEFDSPAGLAAAPDGRVFIADTHNNRVRVVGVDGRIGTMAGTGHGGFLGDGGAAMAAQLWWPRGLALTSSGDLLIADANNQRVRKVSATGTITTVAGSGREGASAEGAVASLAALRSPRALGVSGFGLAAVVDTLNGAVRLLTPAGLLYQPAAFAPGRASSVGATIPAAEVYGQASASVNVSGPIGTPQGSVVLSEAGVAIGNAPLNAGSAALGLPLLGAGDHVLTATYAGDGLNPAATVSLPNLTVTPAAVTASAAGASVQYGAPMPLLSGTVSGVLPQDAGQVAAVFSAAAPTPAIVGVYPIRATLTGARSGNYTVSLGAGSGSLQITRAGTQTSLSSVAQSYTGLPLRVTASVNASTSGEPSGTVQFLDGGSVVASAPVVNGSATAVYLSPPAGTRSLSAQYGGDMNFVGSTSLAEQAVVSALPDFGVSVSGSSAATVAAGSTAIYTVQVNAGPGPFTGVVVLSASGLPAGATASFSPVQVVPGAGGATVTMAVQTPLATASVRGCPAGRPVLWAGGLACLLLLGRRKRRLLLLAATVCLTGCGARTVGEGSSGVTSQTYTVQVSGTSTNLLGSVVVHATTLTLVVQQ